MCQGVISKHHFLISNCYGKASNCQGCISKYYSKVSKYHFLISNDGISISKCYGRVSNNVWIIKKASVWKPFNTILIHFYYGVTGAAGVAAFAFAFNVFATLL